MPTTKDSCFLLCLAAPFRLLLCKVLCAFLALLLSFNLLIAPRRYCYAAFALDDLAIVAAISAFLGINYFALSQPQRDYLYNEMVDSTPTGGVTVLGNDLSAWLDSITATGYLSMSDVPSSAYDGLASALSDGSLDSYFSVSVPVPDASAIPSNWVEQRQGYPLIKSYGFGSSSTYKYPSGSTYTPTSGNPMYYAQIYDQLVADGYQVFYCAYGSNSPSGMWAPIGFDSSAPVEVVYYNGYIYAIGSVSEQSFTTYTYDLNSWIRGEHNLSVSNRKLGTSFDSTWQAYYLRIGSKASSSTSYSGTWLYSNADSVLFSPSAGTTLVSLPFVPASSLLDNIASSVSSVVAGVRNGDYSSIGDAASALEQSGDGVMVRPVDGTTIYNDYSQHVYVPAAGTTFEDWAVDHPSELEQSGEGEGEGEGEGSGTVLGILGQILAALGITGPIASGIAAVVNAIIGLPARLADLLFNAHIMSFSETALDSLDDVLSQYVASLPTWLAETGTVLDGLPSHIALALDGNFGDIITAVNNVLEQVTGIPAEIPEAFGSIITGIPAEIWGEFEGPIGDIIVVLDGVLDGIMGIPRAITDAASSVVTGIGTLTLDVDLSAVLSAINAIPLSIAGALGLDWVVTGSDELSERLEYPESSSFVLPTASWAQVASVAQDFGELTPLPYFEECVNIVFDTFAGNGSSNAPRYVIVFPNPWGDDWQFVVDFALFDGRFVTVSHALFYVSFGIWYWGFLGRIKSKWDEVLQMASAHPSAA